MPMGIGMKEHEGVCCADCAAKVNVSARSNLESDINKYQIIQLIIGVLLFLSAFIARDGAARMCLFTASYLVAGYEVLYKALKNLLKLRFTDENSLMSIATICAFVIGSYSEGAAVMLFYLIGEYFQDLAVCKSKKSITKLMDIRPDYANLKKDDELLRVSPETVKIGDIIIVKPGEKIPLDGIVIEGESWLDTRAITGEFVPRHIKLSDAVLSGCVNQSGVVTIEVTKTYENSAVSRIIDMVENAVNKKAPIESFITAFSKYYTPFVICAAVILAVAPPLFFGAEWSAWLYRALIFLVISCPCALVISVPLGFFGGIGNASEKGILVKGSNYLDALNKLDIVVFDKTGTLTEGVFEVVDICPANGFAKNELLEYAARAEVFSNHPIALSILKAYGKTVNTQNIKDYREIAGRGVSADGILAGNDKLMESFNIQYSKSDACGSVVYVAVNGKFAGAVVIADRLKEGSARTVAELKKYGVRKTVMLTGDNAKTAERTAEQLGIDEVYSELLPEQKASIAEKLFAEKNPEKKLAFVGDGINDAPVLARADIGIAMGHAGADAAVEAADIALMTDRPEKLLEAIEIAKGTKRIIRQNIIFALGVKGIFLILGAFGVSGMWEAVFADVGVSVIAVLNSVRATRIRA